MKILFQLSVVILIFTQCQRREILQGSQGTVNKVFEIALNQTITLQADLREGKNQVLGKIRFRHLDDSRCPANAMCIRQGAAIVTFEVETNQGEKQNLRLFIGDFMPDDARKLRNRTADTVLVQLHNKVAYQVILKQVLPYPGTSPDAPKATLLVQRL